MRLWYTKGRVRDVIRRKLVSLLEIPSSTEFDARDQEHINDWLTSVLAHRGAQKYIAARDRALSQTMIGLDVENPAQRRTYHELAGRRLELVRLKQRAEKLVREKDIERRRKAARAAAKAGK